MRNSLKIFKKMENKDIVIDREKKLMLLRWLKNGVINVEELHHLHSESGVYRGMSMEEARAFIKELEEKY